MRSNAKNLSALFSSAVKISKTSEKAEDAALKRYVSSTDPTSRSVSLSQAISKCSPRSKSKKDSRKLTGGGPLTEFKPETASELDSVTSHLTREISSLLCDGKSISSPNPRGTDNGKPWEKVLEIPWLSSITNHAISARRKDVSRERKQKWVFKSTQGNRFNRLVRNCAQKLGTEATLEVFGKLGRETGLREYNALIRICVEKVRTTDDEEVVLAQMTHVFQLLKSMKEQGFPLEDESYGPVLMYLIDMGMTEEFDFFCEAIKQGNPSSHGRLGYYKMLLQIRVCDEESIQEFCKLATANNGDKNSSLRENCLLALCESNRKEEILQLLNIIDITKLSSVDYSVSIFKCLGRLSLNSLAEKFLLAYKTHDNGAENVTEFIFSYAVSIPNLAVENVISKFKSLHLKLEMKPSSTSYEKLIKYCCDLLKVHMALNIINEMFEEGFMPSLEVLHFILHAVEESCEFNLVRQVYSTIYRHGLKPNAETFRSMINLFVKMKDFNSAYDLLSDLEKFNLTSTASMYNAIMVGYFREKNSNGALTVLKKMELAGVKPDTQTFSYLIGNCDCEENIIEYYEELKNSGVPITKHTFMSLINAYANCGQFEKAKEVISDRRVPVKNLNEIKSVLVSALASSGQMSDALCIYEEIKQAGCNLEPKSAISLIEHLKSDGELNRLLQLLDELTDPDSWIDGCRRIILYCVQYNNLSSAVDLLKQLKDKSCTDELIIEVLFDEVFCLIAELERMHLQLGLQLLTVIKKELGLSPSRKCLDFLLSACVNAKDLDNARFIWKEYQSAGLPYNILSYLRMYQLFLACGQQHDAKTLLKNIPKDDTHVRCVIKECQIIYALDVKKTEKKKKKKKESLSI